VIDIDTVARQVMVIVAFALGIVVGGEEMKLVVQDSDTSCGQACIAMILGIDFDTACELVGHRRHTTTKDLIRALRAGGAECDDNLRMLRKNDRPWWHTNTAILRHPDRHNRRKWHWCVYHDGYIFDSAFPAGPTSIYWLGESAIDWSRYTSFLCVRMAP
jgi:hypothetical protein